MMMAKNLLLSCDETGKTKTPIWWLKYRPKPETWDKMPDPHVCVNAEVRLEK